jgi:hypothetical protein
MNTKWFIYTYTDNFVNVSFNVKQCPLNIFLSSQSETFVTNFYQIYRLIGWWSVDNLQISKPKKKQKQKQNKCTSAKTD